MISHTYAASWLRQASRAAGCVIVLGCSGLAVGGELAVGDAGFEDNALTAGGLSLNLGPEWQEDGGPSNGNGYESYLEGFSFEGTDHLGMETGHQVWQDLTADFQADTRYSLRVAVGNRSGVSEAGNLSSYEIRDEFGALLASDAIDASTLPAGSFTEAPVLVFDTTDHPEVVGGGIRVALRGAGNGPSYFDHVRLDETLLQVPGAATIVVKSPTAVTSTGATLVAEVTAIGDEEPQVTFFYGIQDGGLLPEAWEFSQMIAGTTTGVVSLPVNGLSPATSYHFSARATNSAGDSWTLPGGVFETLAGGLAVTQLPATEITRDSAVLGALVTDNGGDNPTVTIYYGTGDGGTEAGSWDGSVSLGSVAGQDTEEVEGLTSGTGYFFRAYAVNSGGETWAASSSQFTTVTVEAPVVSNRSPNGVTGTTASLRGEVDSTGGEIPVVTMFYGPVNGEQNPEAWAHSIELGPQGGDYSIFVSGLEENTNYWFHSRAENSAGTSWSGDSDFFQTTGIIPSTAVINEIHYDPRDESTPGEFVELHNPGDEPIDISGWQVSDAVDFVFPQGTVVEAGAYLVVAQDPATVLAVHGVVAYGPWSGRLNNDGETIKLRNGEGVLQDEVSYGAGFPWPTGPRGGGGSAQLINPTLDNDLGSSWRDSALVAGDPGIVPAGDGAWRYRKGTSEASSPQDAWRQVSFIEDGSWQDGTTSIGYGDGDDTTVLGDMQSNYSSVYLRHTFEIDPSAIPESLTLRVYVDDGAVVWINGTEVARLHVSGGEKDHDDLASNHEAEWETVTIDNAGLFLIGGTNLLAIHALNGTLDSSDFSIDAELLDPSVGGTGTPTPGNRNGVFTEQAPPQIRQVEQLPESPTSGESMRISAKITDPDGMGPVTLEYQVVEPGQYIRKSDPAYQQNWISVPMTDDGTGGDWVSGDSLFTTVLPESLQSHRRLIRYRLTFEDSLGNQGFAPWPDDEQLNFAYYVYDGLPSWQGSFEPGGPVSSFDSETIGQMPCYQVLAREQDVNRSQYEGSYDGVHMDSTLIYDGVVYDNIEFENRGEASTYVSGKNKWRFHFNRARSFQARDNRGKARGSKWRRLNLDACASPWAALHRGMGGVEEAVSYRLYELCGVPSPRTNFAQLRVVDDAVETDPSSQHEGDLWGLYLAVEGPNGSFLDDRDLPDGNVYKIENGAGDKKEQGLGQTADSSDWSAFYSASGSSQSEQWWRDQLDNATYHSFRACNRISGNVDLREGFNQFYYHHPDDYWVPIPWDLDMMFIPETHWAGHLRAQNSLSHPALALEYRNRARELLDLMCSDTAPDGGQIGQLIDEYSQYVNPTGESLTWADLDANMWNHHPRTRGSLGNHSGQTNHKGNFFYPVFQDSRRGGSWTRTLESSDHEGSMQYLLEYAGDSFEGGTWQVGNGNQEGYGYEYLKQEAEDAAIPGRPVISSIGGEEFPIDDLRFSSSTFSDPQGSATFGGIEWRLAEIASPGKGDYLPGDKRRYEVERIWSSGELPAFDPEMTLPVSEVRPGHLYRVRVRHKDETGRWSHWSEAVEFEASESNAAPWRQNLVVTEFMYHPLEPTGAAEEAATSDKDDFEFIEVCNVSLDLSLDLTDLSFTEGIEFGFSDGTITTLGPGDYVLVVKNLEAFEARYGTGLPVTGEFSSGNLSNGGEVIELSYGLETTIRRWDYLDRSPWPAEADGEGASVVLIDPSTVPDHAVAANWRASQVSGGTPGEDEAPFPGTNAAWQAEHFTAAELLVPEISGPDADPDMDGRSNLDERAFGTDPRVADHPMIEFAWLGEGDELQAAVRLQRPSGAIDLLYTLEAGDGLTAWDEVSTTPEFEQNAGEGLEQVVFPDSQPGLVGKRFLRVRCELIAP